MGSGRARRKGRRWGVRTKAKQIVGNLYRGDTGQFQAGGAGSPAAKPKRGVVLSKQPKPPTRTPVKTTAPKKGGGGSKKPAGPKPKDPVAQARQAKRDQEHDADRAQRQADRQARLDRQAARDRDRLAKDMQRQADAAKKKLEKPKGGGGGGSKKPSEADKKQQQLQERAKRADTTASQVGMASADLAALRTATEAGGVQNPALAQLGLLGADGLATDQGRRALSALERGDVRQYQAALQDAKARMGREQGAADRKRQTEGRRAQAANERQARQQARIERLKRRVQAGSKLSNSEIDQLTEAGALVNGRLKAETYGGTKRADLDENVFAGPDRSFPIVTAQDVRDAVRSLGRTKHDKDAVKRGIIRRAKAIGALDALPEDWRTKSFVVFKDHAGQHRWIARTTTAYKDRDGEIISEAALDADSQRMMATKQFGPLRYWHIGQPDPSNVAAPWGPGIDIGTCDYSVVIGRTRIESGTFHSAAIAQQMARVADRHEMSPGFFHPLDQPDSEQTFNEIRTFERSPVPVRYGRASNLFTGFTVKEFRMDVAEMERRFKAMYQELGLTPEQGMELGQNLVATEKEAQAQGIAFKEESAPEYPDVVINGITYKAAPPPVLDAEDDPAMGGDGGIDEAAEGEPSLDDTAQMAGDYLGDMSWDEFAAKLGALLAPVLKMQDMVKSIGDAHQELKGMYGGVAQKDDARAQELAALKSQYAEQSQQIAQLASRIAQIEGDQPSVILPNEIEAALKSAGPTAPADPNAPVVPDDPARPYAAIAARTMPALYRTDTGGGFGGWQPPSQS